jgi:hypothetical protein
MREVRKLLLIIGVGLASLGAAKADEEMTAGELFSFCTSADQVASAACRFYVLGVVQGIGIGDGTFMDATRKMVERKKTIFCLPENTPQTQMVTIVRDTMRQIFVAYPDDKKLPATSSILAAMNRKFPCPK